MVFIDLLPLKIYKHFHIKSIYEEIYRKSLYLCGQIRESIEKNIASNLDGPQRY